MSSFDEPASVERALERKWVEGIQRGDASALESVVRAYGPRLVRFATGLLARGEDAEDVVQEVFWRVWEGRTEWRLTGSLAGYLFTAVRNRALNLIERERLRSRHSEETRQAATQDPIAHAAPSTADVFSTTDEATTMFRSLRRAFATLTERQQTAIRLRYEEGLSFADVAATLGVSVSAAEQLVARAIRAMRGEMPRE